MSSERREQVSAGLFEDATVAEDVAARLVDSGFAPETVILVPDVDGLPDMLNLLNRSGYSAAEIETFDSGVGRGEAVVLVLSATPEKCEEAGGVMRQFNPVAVRAHSLEVFDRPTALE
jgi:hypothetical protein